MKGWQLVLLTILGSARPHCDCYDEDLGSFSLEFSKDISLSGDLSGLPFIIHPHDPDHHHDHHDHHDHQDYDYHLPDLSSSDYIDSSEHHSSFHEGFSEEHNHNEHPHDHSASHEHPHDHSASHEHPHDHSASHEHPHDHSASHEHHDYSESHEHPHDYSDSYEHPLDYSNSYETDFSPDIDDILFYYRK